GSPGAGRAASRTLGALHRQGPGIAAGSPAARTRPAGVRLRLEPVPGQPRSPGGSALERGCRCRGRRQGAGCRLTAADLIRRRHVRQAPPVHRGGNRDRRCICAVDAGDHVCHKLQLHSHSGPGQARRAADYAARRSLALVDQDTAGSWGRAHRRPCRPDRGRGGGGSERGLLLCRPPPVRAAAAGRHLIHGGKRGRRGHGSGNRAWFCVSAVRVSAAAHVRRALMAPVIVGFVLAMLPLAAVAANAASPTAPGAPIGVSAMAGNGQATVSWTPPATDGGSGITGYTITASPGAQTATATGSTTSATVSGLTNGT